MTAPARNSPEEPDRSIEAAPVEDHSLNPLNLSRSRLKMLDFATQQELNPTKNNVGFSARVWAQVSLPYRDPGDVPYWERRNGNVALTMRPALLTADDGSRYEAYPFGVMPRQALTWIASEAVRTQEPTLLLGSSMNKFMEKIGLHKGGRDAKRLTEQLRRLFDSRLSVQGLMNLGDAGRGEVTKYFQIADSVQLWFTKHDQLDDSNAGLWQSEVTLSNEFFRSIVDSPVPVNLDAIRALGSSPMRLDIYLWVTSRMYNLERPTYIKWADLNHQFGSQYKQLRQFKMQFIKQLNAVKIVYPEMRVEPQKDFLVLRPSPPHVAPTKPRRMELI